jgi:hypothetical protein
MVADRPAAPPEGEAVSDVTLHLARWLAEAALLASLLGIVVVAAIVLVSMVPRKVR